MNDIKTPQPFQSEKKRLLNKWKVFRAFWLLLGALFEQQTNLKWERKRKFPTWIRVYCGFLSCGVWVGIYSLSSCRKWDFNTVWFLSMFLFFRLCDLTRIKVSPRTAWSVEQNRRSEKLAFEIFLGQMEKCGNRDDKRSGQTNHTSIRLRLFNLAL